MREIRESEPLSLSPPQQIVTSPQPQLSKALRQNNVFVGHNLSLVMKLTTQQRWNEKCQERLIVIRLASEARVEGGIGTGGANRWIDTGR